MVDSVLHLLQQLLFQRVLLALLPDHPLLFIYLLYMTNLVLSLELVLFSPLQRLFV